MKQLIITFLMCLTLVPQAEAKSAVYRHNPQVTSVLDKADTAGIVVFSDTASMDTAGLSVGGGVNMLGFWNDENAFKDINDPIALFAYLAEIGGLTSVILSFFFLLLLIVLALLPVIIVGLIIYFILKNRNERYRMFEKAMENGRPLPNDFMDRKFSGDDLIWRKGIRNIAIGLGIVVFGFIVSASFFRGVGCIILIYGIGQAVIARTSAGKNSRRNYDDDMKDINDRPLD